MGIFGIFTNFSRLPRKFFKFSRNDICTPSLRAKRSNPVKSRKNNAFTLAEIMIVLTVIGVLTAILLPAARQVTPDENVIKFKKAHNTLHTVIRELVTSDKYYLDGDLGKRANGVAIDGTHVGDKTYFCQSMADVMNAKSVTCSENVYYESNYIHTCSDWSDWNFRSVPDSSCKKLQIDNKAIAEIVAIDGVVYYSSSPGTMYGDKNAYSTANYVYYVTDANGFYRCYKPYCIDIDGINKGEDPFGYGIRVDGKILNSIRATEWLAKSIQGDD